MNKAITIGLIGLLILFGVQQNKQKQDQEVLDYLHFPGVITGVRDDGYVYAVLTEDRDNKDNSIVFYISEDVVLLDDTVQAAVGQEQLTMGTRITAYYPRKHTGGAEHAAADDPAGNRDQLQKDVGFVHVATFADDLVSSDGQLKLNLSTDTVITDAQGKPVTKIAGKTLVVFYTASTRSIPAQTTPPRKLLS